MNQAQLNRCKTAIRMTLNQLIRSLLGFEAMLAKNKADMNLLRGKHTLGMSPQAIRHFFDSHDTLAIRLGSRGFEGVPIRAPWSSPTLTV